MKKIALIIIFFCNQSIFTMMVSNSFNIDRCKKIRNILAKKPSTQKIKSKKENFLQIILSKTTIKPEKLKYNSDTLINKYKKINDLKKFKKAIIESLLLGKHFSIQVIIELLYNNAYEQCINKGQKLVDYILKNYKNSCKEIPIYKPPLSCGGYEIYFWDYCGKEECIILKTIIKAAKENNFELIDFLIRPQTVNLLKEYIAYNPNNLWKEFLKDHVTYYYNKKKDACEHFKKWSDDHKIRKKQEIIKLLIKYNYIENISECTFNVDNSPGIGSLFQVSYSSMSLLHAACQMNNEKILSLLLQYWKQFPSTFDLVINRLDGNKKPPMYYASKNNVNLVAMLIDAGAECHSCPFVAIAWLYETIDTLDQLNCFNKLIKKERDKFVQQQLYLLALMPLNNKDQNYLIKNIDKVLNFFLSNGANFNKRNEIGELPMDIAYRQYTSNINEQEKLKKENKDYVINYEQLYIFFAFSRKTNDILLLSYLSLQNYLPQEVATYILKYFCSLTFEKVIFRSYAQQYTPEAMNEKFKKYGSQVLAKKLHIEINEKINLGCKKII